MEHFHCCAVIRGFRAEQDVEVLVRAIPTLNAGGKLREEMEANARRWRWTGIMRLFRGSAWIDGKGDKL